MNAPHSAWSAMVRFIDSTGARVVFGIPGDDLRIFEALEGHDMDFVLAKDQRNAMFMATGYALTSRRLGFCIVGKGPAVTNAVTGVLECRASCAPVMLVAAGTARRRVGARAFQELDQIAIMQPLAKWAYRVEHPDRLAWAIQRAAYLATSDCPGPTYLEIPEDLDIDALNTTTSYMAPSHGPHRFAAPNADASAFIGGLQRPLFLFGGGAHNVSTKSWYEKLATKVGAAVFVTASGRGAFSESHPLFCGLAGLYTSKALRPIWENCDGVVCFGSRLEETATLLMDGERLRGRVLQVNITAEEMSGAFEGPKVVGSCDSVAESLCRNGGYTRNNAWLNLVSMKKDDALAAKTDAINGHAASGHIHMSVVMDELANTLPADSILVQENGLADMWSYFYPYFSFTSDQISIVPSEQTSLGFGVTAAIGAKAANRDRPVVALVGDGAFNIGRADISTGAAYSLPIIYIVLNNGGFGWLEYQWRRRKHQGHKFRFESDINTEVSGIKHFAVKNTTEIREQIQRALECNERGQTAIIEIAVENWDPPPGVEDFDAL